jgi:ankyrin repeat protein
MASANLPHLPPEIQLQISSHLPRLSDINSFARTSRRLFAILDPQLYLLDTKPYNDCALYWAAETGLVETARKALKAGASINSCAGRPLVFSHRELRLGATPLAVASAFGQADVISLLLEAGADASLVDNRGKTPLYHAVLYGKESAVEALLQYSHAQLNTPSWFDGTPLSTAIAAGHVQVVRVLLACQHLDLKAKNATGLDALQQAVVAGNETIYEMLLRHTGAAVPKLPVIFNLASPSVAETAEILIAAGADVENIQHHAWEPLRAAIQSHNSTIASMLVVQVWQVHPVPTPLYIACEMGNQHFVRVLLANGADPTVVTTPGQTCLDRACRHGHVGIVSALVSHGAPLEPRLLHTAVVHDSVRLVELLLDEGVDPGEADQDGQTPLHAAANWGSLAMVKALVKTGRVNIEARDGDGSTPRDVASTVGCDHVVQFLDSIQCME